MNCRNNKSMEKAEGSPCSAVLYMNACSLGIKQVRQQSPNPTIWSLKGSLGKMSREEKFLYMKEQLKPNELLCGVYEKLTKSSWVRIRQDSSGGTWEYCQVFQDNIIQVHKQFIPSFLAILLIYLFFPPEDDRFQRSYSKTNIMWGIWIIEMKYGVARCTHCYSLSFYCCIHQFLLKSPDRNVICFKM